MLRALTLEIYVKRPNFSNRAIGIINFKKHFLNFIVDTMDSKYNVGLKTLLRESLYEQEFYGDLVYKFKKVQVGKDQEKAQSERDSHSKNRDGKKTNLQSGTYTMKHILSRMSSYFPNRWPLSYLNLIKNMKTYIRRQQHKKF